MIDGDFIIVINGLHYKAMTVLAVLYRVACVTDVNHMGTGLYKSSGEFEIMEES
jgi:hypothetical protein